MKAAKYALEIFILFCIIVDVNDGVEKRGDKVVNLHNDECQPIYF